MTADLTQFLASLSLKEKEITLYLASLKYGPQTASTLSKKTDISRSTVHFVFDELIQKGFASKETRETTTYFSAVQPESIQNILLEKAAENRKQLSDYQELLPLLNSLQNKLRPMPKVRYFEGIEGLCRIVDETATNEGTGLFISSHNTMHPRIRKYIDRVYIPAAKNHKNKNKMIVSEGEASRAYAQKAKNIYDEILFADPKEYPFTMTSAVYDNKVILCSYEPSDLTGIIIENHLIAKQMKIMFEALWREIKAKA